MYGRIVSSVSKIHCGLNLGGAALLLLQHNFLKQCGCPDPDIEDDDDQHVPIAELANDRNGLAYRDAFALQHFS